MISLTLCEMGAKTHDYNQNTWLINYDVTHTIKAGLDPALNLYSCQSSGVNDGEI